MRAFVGHRPLILTGGRAIVENEKGEILLHKRTDFKDIWSLPGGQTEIGESLEETVLREVEEETGIEVLNYVPFGLASNPEFETVTYPNKDVVQLVSLTLYVTEWKGIPSSSDKEVAELGFFAWDKLPPMPPNERRSLSFFEEFKRTRKFQIH